MRRKKRSHRRRRSKPPLEGCCACGGAAIGAEGAGEGAAWPGRQATDLWVPVTPQMLVIAIKSLRRERRPLTERAIADFVQCGGRGAQERYPVREEALVQQEVARKLRCACAVGIALRARGRFRLPRNRGTRMRLNPQEVTAFWRAYVSDRQGQAPAPPCPPCPPDLCAGRRFSRRLGSASTAAVATLTPHTCSQAATSSPNLVINLEDSDDEDEMVEEDPPDPSPSKT